MVAGTLFPIQDNKEPMLQGEQYRAFIDLYQCWDTAHLNYICSICDTFFKIKYRLS